MTEKEYRQNPAVSRSELWKLSESPEKFIYYKEHPVEATHSLVFGQLLHKIVLQPDTVWEDFVVAPTVDRRTKDGKKAYAAFLESSNGKTAVTADMVDKATAMCSALYKDTFCKKLLSGQKEVPYFWQDEPTGENCKCRADCVVEIGSSSYVIDLKSANDASTGIFMRDSIKYGYTLQASMYLDGVKSVTGKDHEFVFIVIEKEPPYSINILQADRNFITHGTDIFRELIGTYNYCKKTGNWYGYLGKNNVVNSLGLPEWLAKTIE